MPEAVAENDGHHDSFAGVLTFQGPLEFYIVAILRIEEINAHEEQNHIGLLQLMGD